MKRDIRCKGQKRRYGRYALLLLLLAGIPSIPVVSSCFQKSLWIPAGYWGTILFLDLFLLPQVHVPGTIRQQKLVQGYVWSGAGIYLAVSYGIGIALKNLAASPYDHSPAGLLGNVAVLFLSGACREYARAYGIGSIRLLRKHGGIKEGIFTLCMTGFLALSDLSWNRMSLVQDEKSLFFFAVQQVLPALVKSGTLSYLACYGGWRASLLYSALPAVFLRCFPFLPQLPWLAECALNLAYPAAFAMWLRENLNLAQNQRRNENWEENQTGNTGVAGSQRGSVYRSFAGFAVMVACSWFFVGVFPVYPSVVLTGSMEPKIQPGDIVLIRKITKEQEIYALKESDVINFKREDYTITHRIQEILRDEAGNVSFCTRGDNNPSEDARAVLPNEINGIVVGVVPKAGLGVLLLKGGKEAPEGVMTGGQAS